MPIGGEFASKVKTNMRDRLNAISKLPDNAATMAEILISKTKETKPIQGILEVLKKAGDGTIDFLETQCEITRRWK